MYNKVTQMSREILIVDDKIRVCESLGQNFKQLGYVCRYATNGSEAIGRFLNESLSAVILDIKLGDENGIDILKSFVGLNRSIPS